MLKTVRSTVNVDQIIGVLPVVNGGTGVTTSTGTGSVVLSAAPTLSGNVGLSTGNLVQGTAAKGINFTANTPAAGMTSQLLNWYEEGTWTAGVTFGGGNTGLVLAQSTGFYTRVGKIVNVSVYILFSNKGSSTGTALITGLPLTINSANGAYAAASLFFTDITSTGQVMGYGNINATTIALSQTTSLGANTVLSNTNFSNSTGIILQLTYRV